MIKTKGLALVIVLIAVIVLVVAGGVWYWKVHNNSATQPASQSTTTATSSTAPSEAITKTTSTYQNTDYGVSFDYPSNLTVKPADTAEWRMGNAVVGDYGLYTKYDPNSVSLITVEIPPSLYPGTNLKGAYFNLSVDKQLSQSQCLALLPQFGPNNIPDKVITIDGVMFTRYAEGTVAAGTEEYSENYTAYTNGTCYEFNLGDTTGNDVSPTGTIELGSANDISVLEGVLPSVKFTSSSTATPVTEPAPTTGANSNNNQSGIDTSSWQTESIHFAPSSVCWTIKYPPTLFPSGANGGYSNSEEFVNSQTFTPPISGVTLTADFNESYSSVASGQTFTTASGLNGSVATNSSGNWRIYIQASENNQNFVLILNPYSGNGNSSIYNINTAEAMARSVTLSCTIPASQN